MKELPHLNSKGLPTLSTDYMIEDIEQALKSIELGAFSFLPFQLPCTMPLKLTMLLHPTSKAGIHNLKNSSMGLLQKHAK
jgi:hypothetical protein